MHNIDKNDLVNLLNYIYFKRLLKFKICDIVFFLYLNILSKFKITRDIHKQGINMKKTLSNIEKKELRKKAYLLKPFVIIGQHGLTDSVLAEINVALNAHELIKIRIRGADKNKRSEQCLQIENELNAEVIHQIGFITVLYRPKPVNS